VNNGIVVKDSAVSPNPADSSVWKVHTGILTPGTTYTLTATGAKDYALNTGNPTKQFTPQLLQGFARWETFEGIGGGAVADLTGAAKFPDFPDQKAYRPEFQAPSDILDNFGTKLSGYFQPPTTGDYVFFWSSDDNGALFLSTDEDPANKKQIAGETQWSGTREWVLSSNTDAGSLNSEKRSDTFSASEWPTPNVITLTAGKRYYIEGLAKEGGGGDNSGATWKLASAADPANGAASLQGAALAVVADPVINISGPANGASITAGTPTTITSTIQASSAVSKVEYFANGTKIGESTTAPYSFLIPSPTPGMYVLTAKVTDAVGGNYTSQPVTAYVHPASSTKKLLYARASGGAFASDVAVVNHLFSKGYDVYDIPANSGTAAMAADKVAVIVSSTAGSGDTAGKYRDITQGVLTWENNIYDDMHWTLNGATDHNVATTSTLTLTAAGAAHPIGAGFTAGDLTIVSSAQSMAYGLPAAGAKQLGLLANNPSQVGLYVFELGDKLIDNVETAKGRRVGFPLDDNTFLALNANGMKLFDQAVDWVSQGGTPQIKLTVTATATTINVTWTGGGTLYSSPTVDGTFTTTGDSDGSYSEPIPAGAAMKFFVVKGP